MTNMNFAGELAELQRALAQCHDMVVRRTSVLEALNLRSGEKVLEVGCGGGFYAYEAAQFVGPTGQVCATDISEDQVAAARTRCAEFSWAECRVADLKALPYDDNSFDAIYMVQVLEYVPEAEEGLQELRRVLHEDGRLIILATNWSSVVWYSTQPERMKKILAAAEKHAPYPNLPAHLPTLFRQTGLKLVRQTPLPILNTSYNKNSFSYWIARGNSFFLKASGLVAENDIDEWLSELDQHEREGTSFFSSTPVITEASKK